MLIGLDSILTMLTELLYPLQYGYTTLHLAARGGHTACVKHLLSGIDANIKNTVSWSIEFCYSMYLFHLTGKGLNCWSILVAIENLHTTLQWWGRQYSNSSVCFK